MVDMLSGFIRRMTRDDLEQVLSWRNHLEVRKYMYTQHEITLTEHASWFERASQDERKHLLIFELGNKPLGFVNFNCTNSTKVADWGFYIAPDAQPGTGRQLGLAAIVHAFEVLRLHKICGQALAFNERSISFHLHQGFQKEGVLRDQHFDGRTYHDVVCFGLLANERPTLT